MLPIIFCNVLILSITTNAEKPDLLDYCYLHPRNTPCMFDCMRSSRCGHTGTSYRDLTTEERTTIVDLHNEKRMLLAEGTDMKLATPNKPQFYGVSYDKESEFIAGCYVKQCRNHPDQMRVALDGTHLGQNTYVISMKRFRPFDKHRKDPINRPIDINRVITAAIHSWFQPGLLLPKHYYHAIHQAYQPIVYPQRSATFTQLVWEKSVFVGCAFMHSIRDPEWDMFHLICNYRPKGNVPGKKVYEIKNDNAQCDRKRYEKNVYICQDYARIMRNDTYEPPIDLNTAVAKHQRGYVYVFLQFVNVILIVSL